MYNKLIKQKRIQEFRAMYTLPGMQCVLFVEHLSRERFIAEMVPDMFYETNAISRYKILLKPFSYNQFTGAMNDIGV